MGAQPSRAALGPEWRPVSTLLLLAIAAVAWQEVPEGPFRKWMTEDVVYIIQPEAGAKEEHYRRIAYSNERFRVGETQGWKTDRGKMYIVMGPPDEILSWPTQEFERWIYKAKDTKAEERYEFRDGRLQPVPK